MANIQLTDSVKIDGKSIHAIDELWTNSSPSAAFSAQTLPLSLSDYSYLVITAKTTKSNNIYMSILVPIDEQAHASVFAVDTIYYRTFKAANTGITISTGSRMNPYGTITTSADYVIPTSVIGIKLS